MGNLCGYTGDKSKLQTKINEYIENGEGGDNSNIAFVQINDLPEYKMCLLKRNIVTNDDEIFNKVKQMGVIYYRYYAIMLSEEEKAYVSSFAEAENIVAQLKEKNSANIDKISVVEKYETELKDFATVENTVASLYEKKKVEPKIYTSTSLVLSNEKIPLNISFINPTQGIISSRFGVKSSIRRAEHIGLDIAAPKGTDIRASAAGTVTYSGYRGAYGNLIIISHGDGIFTYYGHCSKLYVPEGTQVSQGQVIAAVGTTGNSTGNHLHFEIRVNGIIYNPINYVY